MSVLRNIDAVCDFANTLRASSNTDPGRQRKALSKPLVLKYFCDLTSAEIGETLEMPASTVRSLLRKGRLALARALMKRGIER